MTRALICDPDMPAKAQAERPDDIRACIGCNQACIGHFQAGYPISCIQRPETGREREFGTLVITPKPKDVMVVGGGPAGMKAAVVAAQRGHRVTLYEASGRVGGQVLLAERLPGRAEFGGAATNLQSELDRYGVIVKTHVEVDAATDHRRNGPTMSSSRPARRPYRPHARTGRGHAGPRGVGCDRLQRRRTPPRARSSWRTGEATGPGSESRKCSPARAAR